MIEVNNLTTHRANKEFLRGLAKKVLGKENRKELDLSIALVGEDRIKELNKKYRKKDKATDVLSFRYDNFGEVVICPKEVKKNAQRFKSTTESRKSGTRGKKRTKPSSPYQKELARVLIHGILHILGYHHQQMKQRNG